MNKTLIYIVGGIVVVGGVVALTVMKPSSTSPSENGTPAAADSASGMKSLKDLLALGTAQKCTFTNTGDNYESSGVVYTGNGKMRGDFTSIAAGKTVESHMIVDGGTSYVWSDEMAGKGMKMSFEDVEKPATTPGTAPSKQAVNPDEKTNYSCGGWTVDASLLALPTNVEFMDVAAMMQGLGGPKTGASVKGGTGDYTPGASAQMKAMQCGYCAQAGDADSVAQCKAALGC